MSKVLSPKAWYLVGIGAAALEADGTRRLIKKRRDSRAQEAAMPDKPAEPATVLQPAASSETMAQAAETRAISATQASVADDLTEIKGIGPTFAKRLTEAGITTYKDIAATSPERLREVTKATAVANPDEWIAQARLRE